MSAILKNPGPVFLFPGQGSQKPGMARDLYEAHGFIRELFSEASKIAGLDFAALLFQSSAATLQETINTQLAVLLTNQAHGRFCQNQEGDPPPHTAPDNRPRPLA